MTYKKVNSGLTVLLVVTTLFVSSCYTEHSIGRRYVKQVAEEAIPLWFVGANHLFQECLIPEDTAGVSCIMKDTLTDFQLLEAYNRAFARKLASFGFQVYSYAEVDSFLSHQGGGRIVHIAQLEFEEDGDLFIDSEVFGDYEYIESIPIRVIRLHSWIEESVADTIHKERNVFYAKGEASDLIEGVFTRRPFSGEINYTFTRYDMRPSLTPVFFRRLGEEHAQRLFDTWLNEHIRERMDDPQRFGIYLQEDGYYSYDPVRKRIRTVDPSHQLLELDKP